MIQHFHDEDNFDEAEIKQEYLDMLDFIGFEVIDVQTIDDSEPKYILGIKKLEV